LNFYELGGSGVCGFFLDLSSFQVEFKRGDVGSEGCILQFVEGGLEIVAWVIE